MIFSFLLDILFPKRCVGCGKLGGYICVTCKKLLIPIPDNESICPVCEHSAFLGMTHPGCRGRYAPDGLTSFFRYKTATKKLVSSIKYRFVSDMAGEFVNALPLTSYNMLQTVIQKHKNISLIPIPLHVMRLRTRGFNQAEVLGVCVAKCFGIPFETKVLRRVQKTQAQVAMKNRKERLANMRGAFAVNSTHETHGRSFLLFDDVFTTGATMRAATKTLKENGASFVWAVTMAR